MHFGTFPLLAGTPTVRCCVWSEPYCAPGVSVGRAWSLPDGLAIKLFFSQTGPLPGAQGSHSSKGCQRDRACPWGVVAPRRTRCQRALLGYRPWSTARLQNKLTDTDGSGTAGKARRRNLSCFCSTHFKKPRIPRKRFKIRGFPGGSGRHVGLAWHASVASVSGQKIAAGHQLPSRTARGLKSVQTHTPLDPTRSVCVCV